MGLVRGGVGALAGSGRTGYREAMAPDRWTIPDAYRMTMSDNCRLRCETPVGLTRCRARILIRQRRCHREDAENNG